MSIKLSISQQEFEDLIGNEHKMINSVQKVQKF